MGAYQAAVKFGKSALSPLVGFAMDAERRPDIPPQSGRIEK